MEEKFLNVESPVTDHNDRSNVTSSSSMLMRTPRILSPYLLIQEFLRDDPWMLLCAVQMLNLTSARQVWPILPGFFERWPDPITFIIATDGEVATYIKSLGLYNRRTRNLKKMTDSFLLGSWEDPEDLPGIGKYGADSYRIFISGYLVTDVQDKELKKYVQWAREEIILRSSGDCHGEHGRVRRDMQEAPPDAREQG